MGGGNHQQHHHQQGPMPSQPPPPTGGFSNSIPPQGGGPHNGRMGMGMNRNGNNHINHGMATGYASLPPGPSEGSQGGTNGLCVGGGYSHTEANHVNHSGPALHPNFNSHGHQVSTKSVSQPYSYNHQGGQPNLDPRSPFANHNDTAPPHHHHQYHQPHHPGSNGRTSSRGGYRNLVERPHPYSRPPPSDPPRHSGGWR